MLRAADFYEDQKAGLGPRFLKAVDPTIQNIAEHPEFGTKLTAIVRRRLVLRYPFSVIYEIEPALHILAVLHQRCRLGY